MPTFTTYPSTFFIFFKLAVTVVFLTVTLLIFVLPIVRLFVDGLVFLVVGSVFLVVVSCAVSYTHLIMLKPNTKYGIKLIVFLHILEKYPSG